MLSLGCGAWLNVCKTLWLTLWQTTMLTPGLPVHALLKASRWHLSKVPDQLRVAFLGSLSRGEPLSWVWTFEEKQSFLEPASQVFCTTMPLLCKGFLL